MISYNKTILPGNSKRTNIHIWIYAKKNMNNYSSENKPKRKSRNMECFVSFPLTWNMYVVFAGSGILPTLYTEQRVNGAPDIWRFEDISEAI